MWWRGVDGRWEHVSRLSLIAAVCGVLAACHTDETRLPTSPQSVGQNLDIGGTSDLGVAATMIDRLTEVWRAESAFAGMYRDEDGALVIRLTDVNRVPQARAAIRGFFPSAIDPARPLRAEQAKYAWDALASTHRKLLAVPPSRTVVAYDIDERHGQIMLGVRAAGDTLPLRQILRERGVPDDIVYLVVFGDILQTATLADLVRPLRGGLYIEVFQSQSSDTINVDYCTLGLMVRYSSQIGFFSASHCSQTTGVVDANARVYQNDAFLSSNQIGVEQYDPPIYSCPGMPYGRCVSGDVSFYRRVNTPSYSLGVIAKTTSGINIDPSAGNQLMVDGVFWDPAHSPIAGDPLWKTGPLQGEVGGTVESTCVDLPHDSKPSGNPYTIVCQDFANMTQGGGESGAAIYGGPPIYYPPPGHTILVGIAWGGTLCTPTIVPPSTQPQPVCAKTIYTNGFSLSTTFPGFSFQ